MFHCHVAGTAASLKAFDKYFTTMQNSIVNQHVFISNCIDGGIIEDDMPNASDEIQMEKALTKIRKCIYLKGIDVFNKLLKVFRITEGPQLKELGDNMESMYTAVVISCIAKSLCYVVTYNHDHTIS